MRLSISTPHTELITGLGQLNTLFDCGLVQSLVAVLLSPLRCVVWDVSEF